MALIGGAAMLLWYDIVPGQVAEHDEWHTREHFPERVGIPGFLRAQRWVAHASTAPRYFVSYEVRDVGVLTSEPYETRLNQPSDWTRSIMPHFRGMVRGFCGIERNVGTVLGAEVLVIRYAPSPGREATLDGWLADECLPAISRLRRFASASILRGAVMPPMTAEQRLRGRDETVDRVAIVSSYDGEFLQDLRHESLGADALEAHGAATGSSAGYYRLACRADAAALA